MIFLNIRRRGNFSQKTYKIIKDENKYDFENQIFFYWLGWGGVFRRKNYFKFLYFNDTPTFFRLG